ncbi:hypothetical protein CRUP_031579 [Coryphaenoides rupestris]|nr:hypothetical protein CRUP_031579 [Coryphaenoides rupestris]
MSSSADPSEGPGKRGAGGGGAGAGGGGFRDPGLRGARTTTLFRAVNPELFIKPNKPVMALGLLSISLCVGYLGYLHANKPVMALGLLSISLCVGYLGYLHAVKDNTQELYEATDSQGDKYMRRKTSKWD